MRAAHMCENWDASPFMRIKWHIKQVFSVELKLEVKLDDDKNLFGPVSSPTIYTFDFLNVRPQNRKIVSKLRHQS